MKLSQTIGYQIQKTRKKRKLTLEQVASMLDYNLSSLSKIERGDYEASYQTLCDLAKLYDVEVAYFFNNNMVNTTKLSKSAMIIVDEVENDDFSQNEIDKIVSFIKFIKHERSK